MTDWADEIAVDLPQYDNGDDDYGYEPGVIAQALRDVRTAETARCLGALREIASGLPKGSPAWLELAAAVRLIDSGEAP